MSSAVEQLIERRQVEGQAADARQARSAKAQGQQFLAVVEHPGIAGKTQIEKRWPHRADPQVQNGRSCPAGWANADRERRGGMGHTDGPSLKKRGRGISTVAPSGREEGYFCCNANGVPNSFAWHSSRTLV